MNMVVLPTITILAWSLRFSSSHYAITAVKWILRQNSIFPRIKSPGIYVETLSPLNGDGLVLLHALAGWATFNFWTGPDFRGIIVIW